MLPGAVDEEDRAAAVGGRQGRSLVVEDGESVGRDRFAARPNAELHAGEAAEVRDRALLRRLAPIAEDREARRTGAALSGHAVKTGFTGGRQNGNGPVCVRFAGARFVYGFVARARHG
jgi:hypothetical protein